MITLYQIKPKFVELLRPIASLIVSRGITANQVTLAALIGSILVGLVLFFVLKISTLFMLVIPVWMFLRMALNAIDGIIAKEHNQKTPLGGYLNELADVVSDVFLFLPFSLISPFSVYSIGLVIVLSIISEFSGVLSHAINIPRRYDGPMGKSDRALVFGVLAIWIAFVPALPAFMAFAPWVIATLILINCYSRINKALIEYASK
ncbi:CDP-alcohol phosphatidyltransferase family protein [Thorsellia kenyensis]|uniref:CDP-alcohol phosphatidyltransferase family protein n=1 Tax=Thorsellia kenyensis TaxID=1549888 RepID=A0ABV6CFQ4_9GAMM